MYQGGGSRWESRALGLKRPGFVFCISVWSYIYNNKWEYISFAFYFIILNYIFSIKVIEIYYIKSTEKKGKSFRNHSLHGKIAASVLLKLFINGNDRCTKTRIMHARNYIIHAVQLCKNERKCTSLTILYYIRIHVEIFKPITVSLKLLLKSK